ncbi:TolC family protein [Joostella sp. CR20]|uniref:TolC family protein n=1 Tax=Joostella sp. CR20 TaxID=2804312 RepID=UPI00313AA02E
MKKYFAIFFLLSIVKIQAQEVSTQVPDGKVWTLQECLDYAVENSITVKDAQYNEQTATVTYKQSKSSRLPNLTSSASQTFTNGQSIDPITSDFVNEQIHSTSFDLNSSVTIFQGNQLNNQIKQSKLLVDQNSLYVEEAKNNIILSVTEAYLQALYAKEGIIIAEKNLEASEKESATAKARYEAGSIAMQDYTDAISQEATNKYSLIEAKNSYAQQLITLKQLLELEPLVNFEIEAPNTETYIAPIISDRNNVYEAALEYLPEYEAAALGVDVSKKDLEIAKGAYLPSLALSGSLGSGYTSVQDFNFKDQMNSNFNQRVGLSLTVPIFNRNQTKAEVQKAKIAIDQSKIQQQTIQKEIYKKVETAYQNVVATQEQLEAAKAASTAAEESYKLAQKKYDLGGLNSTDLIISQNTFTNAQQNYLQAKYLNILYTQLLEFYQGNEIKI